MPGTKKEDVLDGQFAYPVDQEGGLPGEDFLEGLCYLGTKEDFLQTQFACAGDKELRRISWKHNSLVSGTKKEDFLQGQFAYPGDKDGGNPANSFAPGTKKEESCRPVCVCLSWVQRRMTS